jgi:formylglycine-generating enzyme required for sulfatase activity
VARLLARERDDRPGIGEVERVLSRYQALTPGVAPRRDRWWRLVGGALATTIALGASIALVARLTKRAPATLAAAPEGTCPADMARVDGAGAIASFCMDRTEVTAGAYMACVRTSACLPAIAHEISTQRPRTIDRRARCNYDAPGREAHPMNCVTWVEETNYCKAMGKRLPTADEWRWAAAAGSLNYRHPWGNEPTGDDQICWRTKETCAVGTHPLGSTPTGITDLVGNVWEQTSTPGRGANAHVVCGGGVYEQTDFEVLSDRCSEDFEDERLHDAGFRCVSAPAHSIDSTR